jgi:hypothetical protein
MLLLGKRRGSAMKGLAFSNRIFVGVGFSASLLLSSCATNGSYEKILNSWVGAPADALTYYWGPPHKEYAYTDGHRQIGYFHQHGEHIKDLKYYVPESTYESAGVTGYNPLNPGDCPCYYGNSEIEYEEKIIKSSNLYLWCETRFAIDSKGIITNWKWTGNYCVAPLLASLFNRARYPPTSGRDNEPGPEPISRRGKFSSSSHSGDKMINFGLPSFRKENDYSR